MNGPTIEQLVRWLESVKGGLNNPNNKDAPHVWIDTPGQGLRHYHSSVSYVEVLRKAYAGEQTLKRQVEDSQLVKDGWRLLTTEDTWAVGDEWLSLASGKWIVMNAPGAIRLDCYLNEDPKHRVRRRIVAQKPLEWRTLVSGVDDEHKVTASDQVRFVAKPQPHNIGCGREWHAPTQSLNVAFKWWHPAWEVRVLTNSKPLVVVPTNLPTCRVGNGRSVLISPSEAFIQGVVAAGGRVS